MNIIFRKAKLSDIDDIFKLRDGFVRFHETLRGTDPWEQTILERKQVWRKWAEKVIKSPKMTILIAIDGHRPIGYMLGIINKRPSIFKVRTIGLILDTFVLEKYRNKGVGREILKEMLNWFKSKGVEYVETSVDTRNDLAKKAWRSYGFKDFRTMMIRMV